MAKVPTISRDGAMYVLEAEHIVTGSPHEVFPFFSDAANLARLTPASFNFTVLTPMPIPMQAGTVIDYRIRVRGIPLRWQTLITAWDPPHRFVDEQTRGPYRTWIHEHHFEAHEQGTLMRDRVRFLARGPRPFNHLLHKLVVNRDVQGVFAYRSSVIDDALAQWRQEAAKSR